MLRWCGAYFANIFEFANGGIAKIMEMEDCLNMLILKLPDRWVHQKFTADDAFVLLA